jgi:ribosomal protein S18
MAMRSVWHSLRREGWLAASRFRLSEESANFCPDVVLHTAPRGIQCGMIHNKASSARAYSGEAGNGGVDENEAASVDAKAQADATSTAGGDSAARTGRSAARASGSKSGDHSRPPQRSRKTPMSKSLQSAQERVAELLTPGKDTLLMHEDTSYELIGRAEDAPKVVAGASARAAEISPRRIHPHRLFYPGAKYSPEELNPYKAKEVLMRSDLTVQRGSIPKDVVADQADFRNTNFLTYFLKDSGKLVPRRKTALPAKLHRELMREIKISRSLALMDPMSKSTASRTQSRQESDEGRGGRRPVVSL